MTNNELWLIPLIFTGLRINKNIALIIDNEIYFRNRLTKNDKENEIKVLSDKVVNLQDNINIKVKEPENKVKYLEHENKNLSKTKICYELDKDKLSEKIRNLEDKLIENTIEIERLEELNDYLKVELGEIMKHDYSEVIRNLDYNLIIKEILNNSSEIKSKFKELLNSIGDDEGKTIDGIYELWMQWSDDEVTIMDIVLKKIIYEEGIDNADIDELDKLLQNIYHRYLLSRLLLHLMHKLMSSKYWEEVFA